VFCVYLSEVVIVPVNCPQKFHEINKYLTQIIQVFLSKFNCLQFIFHPGTSYHYKNAARRYIPSRSQISINIEDGGFMSALFTFLFVYFSYILLKQFSESLPVFVWTFCIDSVRKHDVCNRSS